MRWQTMTQQGACLAFAGAFFMLAAGCLVTSSSSTKESGARVSHVTLDQIRPGETTEAWVLATAGEPTSRRAVDEHTSILRYDHVTTSSSGGTVLFLFAGGKTRQQSTSVIFEVTDGVVQRYWTES
jgi:hypothetical protein